MSNYYHVSVFLVIYNVRNLLLFFHKNIPLIWHNYNVFVSCEIVMYRQYFIVKITCNWSSSFVFFWGISAAGGRLRPQEKYNDTLKRISPFDLSRKYDYVTYTYAHVLKFNDFWHFISKSLSLFQLTRQFSKIKIMHGHIFVKYQVSVVILNNQLVLYLRWGRWYWWCLGKGGSWQYGSLVWNHSILYNDSWLWNNEIRGILIVIFVITGA